MSKKSYPLAKVYGLLETGPVLLLTTQDGGQANVMTLSWHTLLEFEPPQLGCVVSDRGFSHWALQATGEAVLNIPTVDIAEQVVGCGNTTGAEVDKFARFGLTRRAAQKVAPPLIDECYASLECRVVDTGMVPTYGLYVLEVVAAWVDPAVTEPRTLHHQGYGHFRVAGDSIHLPSRMR